MKTVQKIRTVKVNERGQVVIPEDVRKDFGIKEGTTLVFIEKGGELAIRKESDVFMALEDKFWKTLSRDSLKKAWSKEDEVWDKVAELG